jgi:acetyl-CoA C-acetyltransferase
MMASSEAWIWGVGSSSFGKQPDLTTNQLVWQAVAEAVADAEGAAFDAVFVGTCFGEPGIAQRALHRMGIAGLPVSIYENACASSTQAFHEAVQAVRLGRYRSILVLGIEHLTSRFAGAIPVEPRDPEGRLGLALPALYAMSASRYIDLFGLTDAQLAAVSVKNHRHGVDNPKAQHRQAVAAEEVLASRSIADPLTLLQCCSIADASAAVVVGDRRRGVRDIRVAASAFGTGGLWDQSSEHVWGFGLIRETANAAYNQAGLGIGDVGVLEVHDAFTISEIVTTEALGMAEVGGGGPLVEAGQTTHGGRWVVNPSGGLLARGHPLGATGAGQVYEITTQLRGEAGRRQVPTSVGVVETMGGGVGGVDGNACVVAVLTT